MIKHFIPGEQFPKIDLLLLIKKHLIEKKNVTIPLAKFNCRGRRNAKFFYTFSRKPGAFLNEVSLAELN